MRKIGVVTVARSDYWIYWPILKEIQKTPGLELGLFAGGMHLASNFGNTVSFIEKDGFPIVGRVSMLLDSDTPEAISKSMGLGVLGFGQAYSVYRPDLLLVLGDRFEMLAAGAAALPFKIPLVHIHGGERTEGAIDEAIRHSITKMSHLHFPANEIYAGRLRRMGEQDWRIVVSGAPSLDNLRTFSFEQPDRIVKKFHLRQGKPRVLVTYHPVTLEHENTKEHIESLCLALEALGDADVIFTYPNADTGNRKIVEPIKRFCQKHPHAQLVVNLGPDYFNMLRVVDVMVGNSSSGLIETPFFELPVVNIGNRQKGRVRGVNVIDCGYGAGEIKTALKQALTPEFRRSLQGMENPYGNGHAARKIVKRLKDVAINDDLLMKQFVDKL